MVYIYVCKRFKVTMDMVSSKEGDWVTHLLKHYCKKAKLTAHLERAEINPKKRMTTNSYDSSTDVFKIDLVYKDTKGGEHELKWLIKVTRSDINETADTLLRHEKLVFSLLMGDLINTVKQKGAGRLDDHRLNHKEVLNTPQFIFEETAHQTEVMRNVLVLDNLEEKLYVPGSVPLNLAHLRLVVKTIAKFHAVSLTYKKSIFDTFVSHENKVSANKQVDDVEIEGENIVLTGRKGLFDRFPFLTQRLRTMNHLVSNRIKFLDMYQKLLEAAVGSTHEASLIDTLEYIRMSTDDILRMNEHVEDEDYVENPLDSIALGVLETRSFLFSYEAKKKEGAKLQRSQSERRVKKDLGTSPPKKIPTNDNVIPTENPKSKIEKQKSLPKNSKLSQSKFFQSRSKDDVTVKDTGIKKSSKITKIVKERDPNQPPVTAALVNCKYVTYTRVTRDLAVLFFTSADSLIRRFYLMHLIGSYSETAMLTLQQLGINSDSLGINFQSVIYDFQQHILYGFIVGVLVSMANTNPDDLEKLCNNECPNQNGEKVDEDISKKFVALTPERVEFLVDLMRDVAYYVESKDFELGLPITNFHRYHELWMMKNESDDDQDEEEDQGSEYDDEEEEEEEEISEIDYNNYWVKPLPAENDAFSEEENEILDVDGD